MTTRPFQYLCLMTVLSLFSFTAASGADDKPSDDLIQMIVRLIGNSDREFRAAGLDYVRTSAKGTAATQTFAAQLAKIDAQGQVALIHALADRGDTAARNPILELQTKSTDDKVRAAAIASLGKLGGPADLPLLLKALSSSAGEQAAARQALIQMTDPTVSKSIAAETKSASPNVKAALIDVLGTRRASDEMSTFLAASVDENSQVRSSAMTALGQLARPDQIAVLLPAVLKATKGPERDNAERNVAAVCKKIDNEDQRATDLIEAINKIPSAERDELLPLVGRVGGQKLINFVVEIATSDNPVRRQIGIDALSKWPDASVADKLLEIAIKATDQVVRSQAFQGYVKICATRDNRSDKQRFERMKEAMNAAKSQQEQILVINRTRTAYDVDAVRFVLPYVDQAAFSQTACETIVEIAHDRNVREANRAEFHKALDKVIEVSKDPEIVDRAQRYKLGQTWERKKK